MHFRVIPLDEELEDIGVEAKRRQVDHVIALIVLAEDISTEVNEASYRR